jgi:lipoprotein-anchoring transpeptidase ErfK/SrfK
MASLESAVRTSLRRMALAGLCGVAVVIAAGCGGGSSGTGSKAKADPHRAAVPAAAVPVIKITPATGAKAIHPGSPIHVWALKGHLTDVTARGNGQDVAGLMSGQGTEWSSQWALAPGATFVVQATAANSAGKTVTTVSRFSTLRPAGTFSASLDWTLAANQGHRYGIGLPIILNFSQPVQDKAAVQDALEVTAQDPVPGAWRWITDEQIVYRAETYWPPHQTVTLSAHLAGVRAAAGVYGTKNLTYKFKIGTAQISIVNTRTHHMTVWIDGKVARSYGISAGDGTSPVYTTPSGTAITMDKARMVIMTNPNVPEGAPGWYSEPVPLAVRLTNSGIYLHETPGAAWCLGVENCSHGCVRQPAAEALWFYNHNQTADVVRIEGTDRKMAFGDGWTFYQMPWHQWAKGSTVNYASYSPYVPTFAGPGQTQHLGERHAGVL